MERKGVVTFKGNPLTLIGPEIKNGQAAPDFRILAKDLKEVTLKDSTGTVRLFNVVPSLDTPVCSLQTRHFDKELKNFEGVTGYTVSCDLPFAQARFCDEHGIHSLIQMSDHRDTSFGLSYGVLIKELRLLARSVFVIDRNGKVRYAQIVPETTQEPDYEKALEALRETLKG